MIKLGESSGRLVATIEQLAELTERRQKLERAAASTLDYPRRSTVGASGGAAGGSGLPDAGSALDFAKRQR